MAISGFFIQQSKAKNNENFSSPQTLTELFCAECADAVETEAEDGAVFAADSDVEGVVLHRNGATVGSVADGEQRTNKWRVAVFAAVLEIEKERCAAV